MLSWCKLARESLLLEEVFAPATRQAGTGEYLAAGTKTESSMALELRSHQSFSWLSD